MTANNMKLLGISRAFCIVLMMLAMTQSALAADLMFGPLQFRATVGSMPSSAAYIEISNHGTNPDRLVGVESDLARKTELHSMTMTDGVMIMRAVDGGIDIPAGARIQLAPGGYHVMLIGLKAPLNIDQKYDITLVFQSAGKITISGLAKRPSDLKKAAPHDMKMPKTH